jgi:hypothetical protein
MNQKLKSYLLWSPEEIVNHFGEENHILNYDPYDCPEDAPLTEDELKIIEDYASSHGRIPVIGVLSTNNSEGEYPWSFEEGKAVGGYFGESLEIDQAFDKFQACHRYLLGNDVDSMINCLVGLLFKNCKVGEVDVCALFGWIYVADLQKGESYYGSLDTIFPPNYLDYDYEDDKLTVNETERKTLDQIREEKDQYKHDYPLYRQHAAL